MNLIKWFKESTSLYKHTPALYEHCLQISFPGSMFGAHSRQQRTSTNKTETQQRLTIAFSYFVTVVRQKIYLYLTLCEPISDHHTAIDLNQKTVLFFKPSPSRQTSFSSLFNDVTWRQKWSTSAALCRRRPWHCHRWVTLAVRGSCSPPGLQDCWMKPPTWWQMFGRLGEAAARLLELRDEEKVPPASHRRCSWVTAARLSVGDLMERKLQLYCDATAEKTRK